MAAEPTITDWISAVSTASIGVLGFLITIWQWRKMGFSPRLAARIDPRREAIDLHIVNTGRAGGIIDQIDVLGPDNEIIEDAVFEGFAGDGFRPMALPAMASMRVIIQAPENRTFAAGVTLHVDVGANKPKAISPAASELGIYGLTSVLPPGT